ncbi:hypothetical protein [Helicobacter felis]|uniref:hypothetical protein n=1 Tax=Helicobacter felis TaxID=214 RepID=UPI0013155E17|nr:hypothetical protein [Helicobacter felis]
MREELVSFYIGIAVLVFIYQFVFVSYGTSAYEIGHDFGMAIFWPFHLLKSFF